MNLSVGGASKESISLGSNNKVNNKENTKNEEDIGEKERKQYIINLKRQATKNKLHPEKIDEFTRNCLEEIASFTAYNLDNMRNHYPDGNNKINTLPSNKVVYIEDHDTLSGDEGEVDNGLSAFDESSIVVVDNEKFDFIGDNFSDNDDEEDHEQEIHNTERSSLGYPLRDVYEVRVFPPTKETRTQYNCVMKSVEIRKNSGDKTGLYTMMIEEYNRLYKIIKSKSQVQHLVAVTFNPNIAYEDFTERELNLIKKLFKKYENCDKVTSKVTNELNALRNDGKKRTKEIVDSALTRLNLKPKESHKKKA